MFNFIPLIDRLPPEGKIVLPTRVVPFVWYFVRQFKGPLAFVFALVTLCTVLYGLMPYGTKLLVDRIAAGIEPGHAWEVLATPFLIYFFGFVVGRALIEYATDEFLARLWSPLANAIRRQMALYVFGHSYRFFQDDFAGRISGKVMETPSVVRATIATLMDSGLYIFVLIVTSVSLMLSVSWEMATLGMVWVLIYAGIVTWFVPRIAERTRTASGQVAELRGRYVDAVGNILQVKLFSRQDEEDKIVVAKAKEMAKSWVKVSSLTAKMQASINASIVILSGATLGQIYLGLNQGGMGIGDAAMLLQMTVTLAANATWASSFFSGLFQGYGEIQEGLDLITQAHDLNDAPGAPDLVVDRGEIKIRDMTFAYPGRPVFENMNISIPPGQKVGLVGPSGAGKSTLVQLTLRLFDVQGGVIEIDGQNIAQVTQDSLRRQIGMVPQTSELFHRSIAENIAYGRPDASPEEIEAAARKAHAHDFIMGMKDSKGREGYAAHVGERGVKLSGGQRQRIAIARAILKNAPILILDEATSALDSESEAAIQESMKTLMAGKTVLVIAHRLSTLQSMDRLIVLDQGKIVEDGPHTSLLAAGGLYARLWTRQSGGFLTP